MKKILPILFVPVVVLSAGAQTNTAATRADTPLQYIRLAADDAAHVFSAPARWDSDDWLAAGGCVALVGGAALLDDPVSNYVHNHPNKSRDRIAKDIAPFGAEYSFAVLGTFFAAGEIAGSTNAVAVAGDGLISSVLAGGVITPALKFACGRNRPKARKGAADFSPFSGKASFPSGHATQAFAVGATIAEHYDSLWVQIPAYAIPTLVGLSRIQREAHFPSDVVAGAIIGTSVARCVANHNRPAWGNISFAPVLGDDFIGLAAVFDFPTVGKK